MFARFFKKKICSKNDSERSAVQYIIELSKILYFINPIFMFLSYIQKLILRTNRTQRNVFAYEVLLMVINLVNKRMHILL